MENKINDKKVITVQRRWYSVSTLDDVYPRKAATKISNFEKIKSNCFCSKKRAWKVLTNFMPIISFIQKYKKVYILGDFLSGITTTFVHLPQGLAYGLLAGLQPVNGLYTTFFPVMIYLLFGTSPHISMGSNAVMALLTQTVVQREVDFYVSNRYPNLPILGHNMSNSSFFNSSDVRVTTLPFLSLKNELLQIRISAAMTVSLLTGLVLFGLGVFRLGFLTRYMSVSFVGGFTTAAAIHIASSQISKLLGITVRPQSGAGKVVKMYIELFSNIGSTVLSDVIIGISTIVILFFVKVMINEKYKDRMKIQIPIDFIVVVLGTLISYFGNFEENFNIKIVGKIPSGFPMPSVPKLNNGARLIMDCFVIAILSLTMTISLAKLTAGNHGITIDDNQELIAYGLSNIGSSFFPCFPQSTSPPRTMILSDLGSKTTLNAIPTGAITLCIILWIGFLFQSLPVSILAAMIIVAMKSLLSQFTDLPLLWKINKFDFLIWIITCSVSVLVELDYGLLIGIGFSMISVIIQNQLASGRLIGYSHRDEIFVDTKERANITELKSIKIFQFQAPLNFANAESFKTLLYKQVGNPNKMFKTKPTELSEYNEKQEIPNGKPEETSGNSKHVIPNGKPEETSGNLKHVILDFQMISHVDLSSINVLSLIIKEYKSVGINVFIVKSSSKITETLSAANFFSTFPKENVLYDHADAIFFINLLNCQVTNANENSSVQENTLL